MFLLSISRICAPPPSSCMLLPSIKMHLGLHIFYGVVGKLPRRMLSCTSQEAIAKGDEERFTNARNKQKRRLVIMFASPIQLLE